MDGVEGSTLVIGSDRRLVVICSGGLLLPMLWPLCTGRVFTRDDFAALHLPFRYLYREALRSGDSFLWTSAYHSGFYLHGEGIAGMTHPVHYALYRFLPLGLAFNLEVVTPFAAMLIGAWLLLRQFGLTSEAAGFGAMAFTFSGFNLFNLMHMNQAAVIAHLPWQLLAAQVLLTSGVRRTRALAFAGFAVAVGSQLLIGNPQYVWLSGIVLAFTIGCLWYAGAPTSRVALLLGACVLGALIGAVQLLPTLDFARESTRMAYSRDEALSFSLSPLNLVQLWSPFAFQFRIHAPAAEALIVHEFIVYNGAFCTIALAWLALRWRENNHRPLTVALLVLAGIGLVLAMGRFGGVYAWLAHLPGLRNLRAPSRHLIVFQLALSGMAAIAFEDLAALVRRRETIDIRRLWPLAVPVALSIVTTVAAAALAQSAWARAHDLSLSSLVRGAPWTMVVALSAALFAMASRGARWCVPALIVLAALDLGLWGYSYVYRWGPIRTIADLIKDADAPPTARRGDLLAPMVEGGSGNVGVLRGLRLTPGYTGLVPSSVLDMSDPVARQIVGVAWRETATGWEATAGPMPRARLVAGAHVSADVNADMHRIDVARVALVDRPVEALAEPSEASDASGSAQVLEDKPGAMVIETESSARRLLVLTERFHGGWRATEDGGERTPIRVYGDLLGCVVDAGRHRLALTFSPDSYAYGMRASAAGVVLTIAATALMWPIGSSSPRQRDSRVRT